MTNQNTSEILGVGIVGPGGIAETHALSVASHPDLKLRAILGRTMEPTAAFARRFGADPMTDLPAFLARPDIQMVVVCTPSGTHADIGQRCAAAGKHVLVEKPIDVTMDKARALVTTAERHGVKLGVVYQSRFFPAAMLVKRAIERGRLGRLYMADAYVKWFRQPAYYASAAWRGTLELDGGGALINQAIHTVDLVRWFAGPVASVMGMTTRHLHTNIEVEDTAVALVRYASGAQGVIQASTALAPGSLRRVELHGERGTVVIEGNDIVRWDVDGQDEFDDEFDDELACLRAAVPMAKDSAAGPALSNIDGHRAQMADFAAAIRDNRAPLVDGREGCLALEIVLAVYESARRHAEVALP